MTGVWVDCPTCEGGGGYMDGDTWVYCDGCDGEEGWGDYAAERAQERLNELREQAAHRRATMPDHPDDPPTADELAEREALCRMQSWPDGDRG